MLKKMPVAVTAIELLKALSLGTRIQIIELLKSHGPMCVTDLSRELGVSNSAVSQHLKMLRHAGLVKSARRGFYIPYSLDHEALVCCRQVVNEICACGCHEPGVTRLEKHEDRNLKWLRNYEKRLARELEVVRKQIRGQQNRGK